MAILQYVGIKTSLYTSQSAVQPDAQDSDEDGDPDDCDDESLQIHNGVVVTPNNGKQILFFYDCKQLEGV